MKTKTKAKAPKLKDLEPRKNPKAGAIDSYLTFDPVPPKPKKP